MTRTIWVGWLVGWLVPRKSPAAREALISDAISPAARASGVEMGEGETGLSRKCESPGRATNQQWLSRVQRRTAARNCLRPAGIMPSNCDRVSWRCYFAKFTIAAVSYIVVSPALFMTKLSFLSPGCFVVQSCSTLAQYNTLALSPSDFS